MKKTFPGRKPEAKKAFSAWKIGAGILFVLLISLARSTFIVTINEKNGRFSVPEHQAVEEDLLHPRLRFLREREKLESVTASGRTQFEKIVALRKWTRSQWPPGSKFFYPPWDAVEILDLARKHKNYGFCAQYGVVFLQACLSMGIHARYLDIVGHFVTEVWSDEFDKWILMDPNFDLHYEKNGIPLNAREICEAYWKTGGENLYSVDSAYKRTQIKKSDIELFRMYALYLRNNQLANPVSMTRNGKSEKLEHAPDFRRYPQIGAGPSQVTYVHTAVAFKNDYAGENFTMWPLLTDSDTYTRPLNQTIINIVKSKDQDNRIKVVLLHDQAPAFGSFLVKFNDGAWQKAPERMAGELTPGFNKLSARILTKFGWQGPESSVTLFYKPAWPAKRGNSR
ncbi:MAG TPA: hypothetical protein DCZ92_03425 [Elusimicrobia bacterium]|nr:MAG: hypothetical protein A2016_02875 [Elusimicrobia bacterium GWF2_62_30]HBA59869.1 hypothetical protein [Elusimicrobiota bacterium]